MAARLDPDAVLADHGLRPDADGFSLSKLVAFAEARGWLAGTDEVASAPPGQRYRASVWRSADPGRGTRFASGWVRRGSTPEVALTRALASALMSERRKK